MLCSVPEAQPPTVCRDNPPLYVETTPHVGSPKPHGHDDGGGKVNEDPELAALKRSISQQLTNLEGPIHAAPAIVIVASLLWQHGCGLQCLLVRLWPVTASASTSFICHTNRSCVLALLFADGWFGFYEVVSIICLAGPSSVGLPSLELLGRIRDVVCRQLAS